MKLEDIVKNPLGSFIHMERQVTRQQFLDNVSCGDVQECYSPKRGNSQIPIYLFRVPVEKIKIYCQNASNNLNDYYVGDSHVWLPVHPQVCLSGSEPIMDCIKEMNTDIRIVAGIPLSSSRTLLVGYPLQSHFVKLHFPGRISSVNRNLDDEEVRYGQWITGELKQGIDKKILHCGLLPDQIGMVVEKQGHTLGAIVRPIQAYPLEDGRPLHIPLCSLVAPDRMNQADPTIAAQIAQIKRISQFDFVIEIIKEHIQNWYLAAFELGVILTAHGQNAIIEYDANFDKRRIVYRDFQIKRISNEIRKQKGLAVMKAHHEPIPLRTGLSIAYDFMIGRLLFDNMLANSDTLKSQKAQFRSVIKSIFHEVVGSRAEYFPNTEYTFKGVGSNRIILNTGKIPPYR